MSKPGGMEVRTTPSTHALFSTTDQNTSNITAFYAEYEQRVAEYSKGKNAKPLTQK
jgi:hypothetical protein